MSKEAKPPAPSSVKVTIERTEERSTIAGQPVRKVRVPKLSSLEQRDIPAAEFEPPSGYRAVPPDEVMSAPR